MQELTTEAKSNDELRATFGGAVVISSGIDELSPGAITDIFMAVASHKIGPTDTHPDHDYGRLCVNDCAVVWKTNRVLKRGVDVRTLTIMLEEES